MAKYKPYLTKSEIALIEKLKKIRLENKITQEELAKKAGVTRVSLAELEKHYKKPKKQYILKIAAALDYPIAKVDTFFESAKFDKFIFEQRTTPVLLSNDIIKNQEEFGRLTLESCVFLPYKLIDFILPFQSNSFYAYIMPDDSMRPEIKKNDILIIKYKEIDFKNLTEKADYLTLALVNSKSGKEIIRRYRYNFLKDISSDRITLDEPDAHLLTPNEEYDSIGIYFNKNLNWKIKGIVAFVICEKLFIDPISEDTFNLFDL